MKTAKKIFCPAFGCSQHLKAGQNTQQWSTEIGLIEFNFWVTSIPPHLLLLNRGIVETTLIVSLITELLCNHPTRTKNVFSDKKDMNCFYFTSIILYVVNRAYGNIYFRLEILHTFAEHCILKVSFSLEETTILEDGLNTFGYLTEPFMFLRIEILWTKHVFDSFPKNVVKWRQFTFVQMVNLYFQHWNGKLIHVLLCTRLNCILVYRILNC